MANARQCLWAGLGALAFSTSASASQPADRAADVCGAIARIAASAEVRPAFLPLRRALADGEAIVPGFEPGECAVTTDGVECRGRRSASDFQGWPDLATCPGLVEFEPPLPLPQPRWPSNRSYRLGRFVIARGYRCPGCRALGPSFFIIRFYRPRDWRP